MSRMDTSGGLGEEARFELAMAAAGRARRNRPTALLVGTAAALGVALLAALWGVSARAASWAALSREQSASVELDRLAAEWTRLDQSEREGSDTQVGKPIKDLQTRMEALATRAGLKTIPNHPRIVPSNRPGIVVYDYAYTDARDPELKALMEWMRLATTEVPGLEIHTIILTPEANNWKLDVTFRRWERAGS